MNVNFNEQRKFIETLGNQLFDYITGLSKDIRSDDKERTGIQILGRVLRSRNLVMVPKGTIRGSSLLCGRKISKDRV